MNNETKHPASLSNTGKNVAVLSSLGKNAATLSNSAKHMAALDMLDKSLTTELLLCEDSSFLVAENNDFILIRDGNPWINLAKSV